MFHIYITLAYVIPNIYVYLRINRLFIAKGYKITFSIIYALFAMPYAVNASLANTIEAVRVEMNKDEAE